MIVRFWGTRGSLPAPLDALAVRAKLRAALSAARGKTLSSDAAVEAILDELPFAIAGTYGGNTSCVEIEAGGAEYIVCDLGSGARVFGNSVLAKHGAGTPQTYNVFISHPHWDHMMGFPFFVPAYIPGNRIRIHGAHPGLRDAFLRQHTAPGFPVEFSALAASIEFVELEPKRQYTIGGVQVSCELQHHGGDSYGFRFEQAGKRVVYSTDAEHKLEEIEARPVIELFRDADVLIFDAMYSLADSVLAKEDWGHSSNMVGVDLAHNAGVGHLVLFHHDPLSDDATLSRVLEETRRYEEMTRRGSALQVTAAYDGLEIRV